MQPREVEADGEGGVGDVDVAGDLGGGGRGVGEGMAAENGIWTTMLLVKSSSGTGVGGSGGRLRASATLLDSPDVAGVLRDEQEVSLSSQGPGGSGVGLGDGAG